MKTSKYNSLTLFLILIIFLFAQQISAQEKSENLSLNNILAKLTFTSRISKSTEQINDELIKEIRENKVDFVLTSEDEKNLKIVGANDLLISTINENASEETKRKFLERSSISIICNEPCQQSNIEQRIELAKQYIRIFSNDPNYEAQIKYLTKAIPKLEENRVKYEIQKELNNIANEFNTAFKNKNWDRLFEVGAKFLDKEPEFLDVTLVLASLGFDELTKNSNQNYLEKTLTYAERSIELLENKDISSNRFGAFNYEYKTKDFPDGRANALGSMNYMIGFIKLKYQNEKDAAVLYLEKSLEYKSESNKSASEILKQAKAN